MPTALAFRILTDFDKAQAAPVDKTVILTNGKAGIVEHVWLDDFHGLRISIRGHEGTWPVSTIKLAQCWISHITTFATDPFAPANRR